MALTATNVVQRALWDIATGGGLIRIPGPTMHVAVAPAPPRLQTIGKMLVQDIPFVLGYGWLRGTQ